MVAGDAVRGSVKDRRTEWDYENGASCAKRIWSGLRRLEAEDSMQRAVALVAGVAAERPHAFRAFEVIRLKCDATKQESIDNPCMWLSPLLAPTLT